MHESVSFDGEVVPAGEARIGAMSAAALYGRGIFTTAAIRNGGVFLWEKHWKRLQNDASRIGLAIADVSVNRLTSSLENLIKKNAVTNGRVRITLFDGSASAVWPSGLPQKTAILIATADTRAVPSDFRIEMSHTRVSSLSKTTGIKSCNYLDTLMAYEETRSRGFDEAIRLNESGEVVSACMANVFWLRNGRLFTPDLKTGCVAGTTREFVLEKLDCQTAREGSDGIKDADSIFLTSAGLGVIQAAEFAGRKLPKTDHPILRLLNEQT